MFSEPVEKNQIEEDKNGDEYEYYDEENKYLQSLH